MASHPSSDMSGHSQDPDHSEASDRADDTEPLDDSDHTDDENAVPFYVEEMLMSVSRGRPTLLDTIVSVKPLTITYPLLRVHDEVWMLQEHGFKALLVGYGSPLPLPLPERGPLSLNDHDEMANYIRNDMNKYALRQRLRKAYTQPVMYDNFTVKELEGFIVSRSLLPLSRKPTSIDRYKRILIRTLEKADQINKFPLLELPPEIRNIVYGLALTASVPIIRNSPLSTQPPIVHLCKQVYKESLPIYYRNNIFTIHVESHDTDGRVDTSASDFRANSWLTSINPTYFAAIRSFQFVWALQLTRMTGNEHIQSSILLQFNYKNSTYITKIGSEIEHDGHALARVLTSGRYNLFYDKAVRISSKETRTLLEHELAESRGKPFTADVIMRIAKRFCELGWQGVVNKEQEA